MGRWRSVSTWCLVSTWPLVSTWFVLFACERTPPQEQPSPTSAVSAPAPTSSVGAMEVVPIAGQEATPEALLDVGRTDCNLPPPPKTIKRQEPISEPLCFPKDLLYGVCRSATLLVDRSAKWGWVARLDWRRFGREVERSSDYLMGRGSVDACGTVVYQAGRYPGFSDQVQALLGAPSATVQASLFDDRQRSTTCEPARGVVTFGESSPGLSHETAQRNWIYGKHPLHMEPASALQRAGVCPFYMRSGQHLVGKTSSCVVGTHFAEDNLPAFGKLVLLSDFAAGCTDKEVTQSSRARFYVLGFGEVDACGSVNYRKSVSLGVESVFGFPGLKSSRHNLEMFDHRARRASPQCPARSAMIELHETVEIFQHPNDPSRKPVSVRGPRVRSFYSPKELTP